MSKEGDDLRGRADNTTSVDVFAVYIAGASICDLLAEIRDRMPVKAERGSVVVENNSGLAYTLALEPSIDRDAIIAERDRQIATTLETIAHANTGDWSEALLFAVRMIEHGHITK